MNAREIISRLGLGTKISLSIISILLLLGIVLSVVMSRLISQEMLSENRLRGISISLNLAARVAEPMLSVDFLQLKNLVNEAVSTGKDLSYAFVLDSRNQPLAHTFTGGFPLGLADVNTVANPEMYHVRPITTGTEIIYDFATPVFIGADRLGTVRIGMSQTRLQEAVTRMIWTIFLSIGAGILVVALVSTALARRVTGKIQLLHRAAEEIVKGNLDIQTAPLLKNNCWEIMQCGKTECPAYGERSRRCWYFVGTMCPGCADGRYEKKIESCTSCRVYRKNAGDEMQQLADFFDVMAHTLKERLGELKSAGESLRYQQQIFQTILDVTPDMVSLKDCDLRYKAVNKAFCLLVGREEGEILGRTDAELFAADVAGKERVEDLEVIRTGRTLKAEAERAFHDNGSRRHWLYTIKTAVMNTEGDVIGLLSSSREITEFKELQDRMIRSQRLESLGQLAAGVAHEINTPLGVILGYVQLSIEDASPDTELYENLRIIEKYARVCRTIVADLLRFSRQTESIKKPVNIDEILTEVINVVEHTLRLDRIAVERSAEAGLPAVVGDGEKLSQVFINLLNNAADAIGSDGIVSVTTRFDREAGEVVVSVGDTGKGIPGDIRDRIFDPFFTTKPVGKGTGLGLSVTFGIVKDHGGRIECESPAGIKTSIPSAGPGTLFTLRFPACAADNS